MRISVVYRTTSAQNRKPRPAWYSKRTALVSLLTAAERAQVPVDVTYVVDGDLPEELADLVAGDRRVQTRAGLASKSMRAAVQVAAGLPRPEGPSLLWIAEDDYLYHPDALRALASAAVAVPEASYFALYVPDDRAWHAAHRSQPARTVPELPGGPREVDGVRWCRVASTTSTIGVRPEVLEVDKRQVLLCTYAGSPFDHATYTSLAGSPPYSWRHLLADLEPRPGVRGTGKVVAKPVMRTLVNLSSARYAGRERVLVAPEQHLATHIEDGHLSPHQDWDAIARACA